MKPNVYLRNKGLNFDFKLEGSKFKGTLQNLLKDYKEQLTLTDVSQQRELFVAMFDKMTDDDIQECINGFAERVFNRLSNQ